MNQYTTEIFITKHCLQVEIVNQRYILHLSPYKIQHKPPGAETGIFQDNWANTMVTNILVCGNIWTTCTILLLGDDRKCKVIFCFLQQCIYTIQYDTFQDTPFFCITHECAIITKYVSLLTYLMKPEPYTSHHYGPALNQLTANVRKSLWSIS